MLPKRFAMRGTKQMRSTSSSWHRREAAMLPEPVKRRMRSPKHSRRTLPTDTLPRRWLDQGDLEGAKQFISEVGEAGAKSNIYLSIAVAQLKKGDLEAANQTLANITNDFYRAHALREIALAQAARKDTEAATRTVEAIQKPVDVVVQAYVDLAVALSKAGKKAESRRALDMARTMASKIDDEMDRMVPMAKVAAGEIKIGDVAGAKRMAQEAKNPPEQVTILLNIAEAQIELGDFAGAKATAAQVTEPDALVSVYAPLAVAQARKGNKADAQRLVRECVRLVPKIEIVPLRAFAAQSTAFAKVKVENVSAAADWARAQDRPSNPRLCTGQRRAGDD
jgi:tetratricopeptide (TPR) repeat protein